MALEWVGTSDRLWANVLDGRMWIDSTDAPGQFIVSWVGAGGIRVPMPREDDARTVRVLDSMAAAQAAAGSWADELAELLDPSAVADDLVKVKMTFNALCSDQQLELYQYDNIGDRMHSAVMRAFHLLRTMEKENGE